MNYDVKLWFFRRLLALWIAEKGADRCPLMADGLTEKLTGIDANGYIYWDCLKRTDHPDALMSKTAFKQYLQDLVNQLIQLTPSLIDRLQIEYEQLCEQLYDVLEREALNPSDLLAIKERKLRQQMQGYDAVGFWWNNNPNNLLMQVYMGKLWFYF